MLITETNVSARRYQVEEIKVLFLLFVFPFIIYQQECGYQSGNFLREMFLGKV